MGITKIKKEGRKRSMGTKELLQTRAMKQLIHLLDIFIKLKDLKNKYGAKRIEEEFLNLRKEKKND
tara:strand:+ start:64 stop:261 length:198 start_codon:yes stop_codon:yes gene_type:complete